VIFNWGLVLLVLAIEDFQNPLKKTIPNFKSPIGNFITN
jgi:hypothetical protein